MTRGRLASVAAAWRPLGRPDASLVLLPVLWMLSTSFQASEKMFQLAMEWIPSAWHPENYPNALARAPFPQFFLNSVIVSTAVMAGNVVFCTLAGYGLAKFRFPGRPLRAAGHPEHADAAARGDAGPDVPDRPLSSAGSTPTRASSRRCSSTPSAIFLMRQFDAGRARPTTSRPRASTAPASCASSGRSSLPQCRPALAVLALFAFRDSWDQFLWPLAVVSRDEYRTYPLGLVQFARGLRQPADRADGDRGDGDDPRVRAVPAAAATPEAGLRADRAEGIGSRRPLLRNPFPTCGGREVLLASRARRTLS